MPTSAGATRPNDNEHRRVRRRRPPELGWRGILHGPPSTAASNAKNRRRSCRTQSPWLNISTSCDERDPISRPVLVSQQRQVGVAGYVACWEVGVVAELLQLANSSRQTRSCPLDSVQSVDALDLPGEPHEGEARTELTRVDLVMTTPPGTLGEGRGTFQPPHTGDPNERRRVHAATARDPEASECDREGRWMIDCTSGSCRLKVQGFTSHCFCRPRATVQEDLARPEIRSGRFARRADRRALVSPPRGRCSRSAGSGRTADRVAAVSRYEV